MDFNPATRRLRLDPGDPAFFADPCAAYAKLPPGPVFWEDYGFWCFKTHATVAAMLRDRRLGRQILHVASRESLGWPERPAHLADFDALETHSLLEMEPPEHTRLRALVGRAFVSRQIERLGPSIAARAESLIDAFAGAGEADLIEAYATPLAVAIIAELIGAPLADAPQLLDWSHKMVAMYAFAPTRADEDAAAGAAREFGDYVRVLVAERRAHPGDDLVSTLIAAQHEEGRISDYELITTVVLLLNAGHEATVHALGNSVRTLLEQGCVFNGSILALEELLRFATPLHLFTRYVLETVEVEGVSLRFGERVGILLAAANRDPKAFHDPDRLDLTRVTNPHLAFGAGAHFCVGAPLARLELRIALEALFRKLPTLALAEAPQVRDAFHFHGLERLRVRWRPIA